MKSISQILKYVLYAIAIGIGFLYILFFTGIDIVDLIVGVKDTKLSQACDYASDSGDTMKRDISSNSINKTEVNYFQRNISKEDKAKKLISESSIKEIEKFNRYGRNALTTAIIRHHLELVKLMLEKGVNINLKNSRGEAPLFFAMQCADPEYAKCLVENGAIINSNNDKCLYDCIKDGIPDQYNEKLSLLLRNGAGCEIKAGDYDNYKNISVTKTDLDAYLKKYHQIRDYKEGEIWLLSCLKKNMNVKNELAKLYINRSESYLQIANDKKMALQELQKALTFAEGKKTQSEIKSKITVLEIPE